VQTSQLDRATIRRLAETRPPNGGRVVSMYLSLEPSEFATPGARETEVNSLLDEAQRELKAADDLSREERRALVRDLERIRQAMRADSLPAEGARSLAVFASTPADLFEILRLPRPVGSQVVLDRSPYVEPLVALTEAQRSWAVLLVNRRTGRLLQGTSASLAEVTRIRDDVRDRLDNGDTEQVERERSIEHEKDLHIARIAEAAFRHFQRRPFERLLVGCPAELRGEIERGLHTYLRDRLAGHFDVDVENANPDEVLDAARPLMKEDDRRRERDALDRLRERLAAGRDAVAGLAPTLEALSEQRVETLLVDNGFQARGVRCPSCGWLGEEGDSCPADGTDLERRTDVVEDAVERALLQSADILIVRHHDDLGPLGQIGALLRF
jgi:peptide chain release factor subunit 1